MDKTRTTKISTTAIFAAMIFVVTYLVRFPMPLASGGYVNIGDTFIYLGAFVLGGPLGALAAAIGSSLADLLSGYTFYALPTFIIKGLMGLVCGYLAKGSGSSKRIKYLRFIAGCIIAGAIMVGGYFIFEFFTIGLKTAIPSAGFNAIQWLVGIGIAAILYPSIAMIARKVLPSSDLSIGSPEGGSK